MASRLMKHRNKFTLYRKYITELCCVISPATTGANLPFLITYVDRKDIRGYVFYRKQMRSSLVNQMIV
jgi:hypothetical protein